MMTKERSGITFTAFQLRALRTLQAAYPEPLWHEKLYPILFPKGRFNKDFDCGNAKGGPSRIQCAVNWHLAKLVPLVRRDVRDSGHPGGWLITAAGRSALAKFEAAK